LSCGEIDKQLFRLSTTVLLGNGNKAKFWDSPWLDGSAPRDIAPRLFKLAWRKNHFVATDLQNNNCLRGLWRMTQAEEMAELITLWALVDEVQLQDREDVLRWRWTADGIYTSKSAYEVQFRGSFCTYNSTSIWKAKAEGKHKFFTWLLIQSKILMADKLQARNWPCNPVCPLCDQAPETAEHISLHCVFLQEVWVLVNAWTTGLVQVPSHGVGLEQWWNSSLAAVVKDQKRRLAGLLMRTAWNIWKERNMRVFEQSTARPARILALIKEEVSLRITACAEAVWPPNGT
jgi:hypothetical protein